MAGGIPITANQGQYNNSVIQAAKNAGFSGLSLVIVLAIARAESGWNTKATNTNSDTYHSVDRGILQINNHWHPEVSDTCAFDMQCSFNAAYRISQHGTNFNEWSTYNSQNGKTPAFYAYVSSISGLVNVPIPSTWQTLESNAQNDNVKNVPVVGGIVSGVDTIGGIFQGIGNLFNTSNLTRIGIFALGGLVIVGGVVILAGTSDTGKSLIESAVMPEATIAKNVLGKARKNDVDNV